MKEKLKELLDSKCAIEQKAEQNNQKAAAAYKSDDSAAGMSISSPEVAYGAKKTSSFGTENYFAQIMSLLPKLLLSEKSRLLTAVAQSMTEEVEIQTRARKSRPMKVNQTERNTIQLLGVTDSSYGSRYRLFRFIFRRLE